MSKIITVIIALAFACSATAQTIEFYAEEGCAGTAVTEIQSGSPFWTYFKLYTECAVTLSGAGITPLSDTYSAAAHCIGPSTPTLAGTVSFNGCAGVYTGTLDVIEVPAIATPTETPTETPTPTNTPLTTPIQTVIEYDATGGDRWTDVDAGAMDGSYRVTWLRHSGDHLGHWIQRQQDGGGYAAITPVNYGLYNLQATPLTPTPYDTNPNTYWRFDVAPAGMIAGSSVQWKINSLDAATTPVNPAGETDGILWDTSTATPTATYTPTPTWTVGATVTPGASPLDYTVSAFQKWGAGQKGVFSGEIGLVPGNFIVRGEIDGSRHQLVFSHVGSTDNLTAGGGTQYLYCGKVLMAVDRGPVLTADGSVTELVIDYDVTDFNTGATIKLQWLLDGVVAHTETLDAAVANDKRSRSLYARGTHTFSAGEVFSVRLLNDGSDKATVENISVLIGYYLDD